MALRPDIYASPNDEFSAALWHFRRDVVTRSGHPAYANLSNLDLDNVPISELRTLALSTIIPQNLIRAFYDEIGINTGEEELPQQSLPTDAEQEGGVRTGTLRHRDIIEDEEEEPVDVEDVIETIDFSNFFELQQVDQTVTKKFAITRKLYDVKIANPPCAFNGEQTVRVMPKVLEALMKKLTDGWDQHDKVLVDMGCANLEHNVYLTVRKLIDWSVDDLMQKLALINSQQRFTLDEHFTMRVTRMQLPSGGGSNRRRNSHDLDTRKRFSKSLVQVKARYNLCLPASLFLGFFHQTKDVKNVDRTGWKKLTHPERPEHLEREAMKWVAKCKLKVGRQFDIGDDLEKFQRHCIPDYQIVVLGEREGFVLMPRGG